MLPSEDDVAKFLAFAPDADEGKAFMFLEGAPNVEEAVNEFYEDPDKYSRSQTSSKSAMDDSMPVMSASKPVMDSSKSLMDASNSAMDASNSVMNASKSVTEASKSVTEASKSNASEKAYSPPSHPPPTYSLNRSVHPPHTNAVIQAAHVRARDEQEMQNLLQNVQLSYRIYNSDIEPEHETDFYCTCAIHQYKYRKMNRLLVQEMWSKAVAYPGEKFYHDCYQSRLFTGNPYQLRIISPYGYTRVPYSIQRPRAGYYTKSVQQTIQLNAALNAEAQASINAKEPKANIWDIDRLESSMSNMNLEPSSSKQENEYMTPVEKRTTEKRQSVGNVLVKANSKSKFSSLKAALIKSPEEKAAAKTEKSNSQGRNLRNEILKEEQGRWPDEEWRHIVATYQEKVSMTRKIADLRNRYPIQYLHLLRAGYFEPIPVAWANQASNPLKFSIEASAGWRGITPAWRGYEDTAEERLYWVLNHREGSVGMRLKPDFISAMDMARARMASAVPPPPAYFAADDTCHVQHTSEGYSKQVMPAPFRPFDAQIAPTDDTMILLDVSGSMDFDPVRPVYDQYLITSYTKSTQPKNKDVAKAVIRRFSDAMSNYDHNFEGYQLTTFSSQSHYVGVVNHWNLDKMWKSIKFGGGTRVMTGWQKVKELHFQKHSESATHHPVYGWQAGPQTPMLRLLLLLDGEATDMDEFELDLLALSWVHVTIFLIGVDGCPHHHRHANELQRISEVNHHVSFVDAQGNTPERFVTHELLKRHLGFELSMPEFEELEHPPPYSA